MNNLIKTILVTAMAAPFLVAAPTAKTAQNTTQSTTQTTAVKTETKAKGHKKHVVKSKSTEKTAATAASQK